MGFTTQVHIGAATLALACGSIALYAAKGRTLHRKSGLLFVYAMLAMSLTGAGMAAFSGNVGNVVAGVLTAYLVVTALLTVRPTTIHLRRFELAAMLVALVLGAICVVLGFSALASPRGTKFGIPFVVFFMFGTVALLAAVGDARMIRSDGLRGAPRLTRHLWRMCYAFWIATASFFLGPRVRVAKLIPEPLLTPAVLALPVLTVLVVMFYWLWRLRVRYIFRPALRRDNDTRTGTGWGIRSSVDCQSGGSRATSDSLSAACFDGDRDRRAVTPAGAKVPGGVGSSGSGFRRPA